MKTADVIVVGAGVNGVSTAFHLAQVGVKHVVVVERAYPGAGSTGKSSALVRTNYQNEAETRLAVESMTYFRNWFDLVGGNCGCMLMQSPDAHPIIGELPPYSGLFCMTGDSGTSFKTSPAIGKSLAELITQGQAQTVDLKPFRATRFAEGQPWQDDFTYGSIPSTVAR